MIELNQLRQKYLEQNTQFILLNTLGKVIESDDVLFSISNEIQIDDVHPFFSGIIDHISLKPMQFSCVHLDINNKVFICDITLKKINKEQFLVILSDFSKHYNSFQNLAQSRNETAINSELLELNNTLLHTKEQFKNKFIANFSHEIVSPILSIMTFSNILRKTRLTQEQKEYVDIINVSSNALKSMTNDIFDLSKIETGNLKIVNIRFSLKKLIKTIHNEYKLKCENLNLDFKVVYHQDMPTYIVSDKIRILQVIKNLLNNAIKFTPSGGILLEIKPIYKRARKLTFSIEIKDTGIGIDKKYHDFIFGSFNRLETSKEIKGTGLGLTITKEIVELMKGDISIDSTLNQGTSFIVTLRTTTPLKESSKPTLRPITERKEILLVENNYNDQLSIFKILAVSKHYYLDIANNGEEAIHLIKTKTYDLILMDYLLPKLNGLEVSKAINDGKKKTPIIIATGSHIDKNILKHFQSYFNSILMKPFDEDTLIQTIEKHLK